MLAITMSTRLFGAARETAPRPEGTCQNRDNRTNRQNHTALVIGCLATLALVFPNLTSGRDLPPLRAQGRHFVDDAGRVVILRGVNLAGNSKVPPFQSAGPADLDRVAGLGMNVIRLLFIWEAYEPYPDQFHEEYINMLTIVAEQAAARGIYTIIDFHQDGFSRYCSRGAGDGFPSWAVSKRGTISAPDNTPACSKWPILMATDPTTHRSFKDFHADVAGVRTSFLRTADRVATHFANVPGVIGYDLLNEPWGDEKTELTPLYADMARVIRSRHPSSLMFVEGSVSTNCGLDTGLTRPEFGGFAYAPHYYKPLAIALKGWRSTAMPIDRAFRHMDGRAEEWNCPLFVGEFGVDATSTNADAYIAAIYDRLDAKLASAAQWNLTPGWTPENKDGWNGEDFSIVDANGNLRQNFRPRPYPRITAGTPIKFEYLEGKPSVSGRSLIYSWNNRPELGATEIALPDGLFRVGTRIEVLGAGVPVQCVSDFAKKAIICNSNHAGTVTVRIFEPGAGATKAPAAVAETRSVRRGFFAR